MVVMFSPRSPPWRSGWMPNSRRQEITMKALTMIRAYGRYAMSALVAIAFGIDPQ